MIEIYQGRIGGGKTYAAVDNIAIALAQGRTVYTNISFNPAGLAVLLAKKYGYYFIPDALRPLPDNVFGWQDAIAWGVWGCPVLVVIDEAQCWYNSRDWSRTAKEHLGMLSFLTQSRKACVDVVFITQHADNIDRQFRLLAQSIWSFRDLGKFGPLSWIFGNTFLAVATDYSGEKIGSRIVWKDKRVFKAYETLSFLDEYMQGAARGRERVERRRLKRVSIFWRVFGRNFLKRDETGNCNRGAGAPGVAGVGQTGNAPGQTVQSGSGQGGGETGDFSGFVCDNSDSPDSPAAAA